MSNNCRKDKLFKFIHQQTMCWTMKETWITLKPLKAGRVYFLTKVELETSISVLSNRICLGALASEWSVNRSVAHLLQWQRDSWVSSTSLAAHAFLGAPFNKAAEGNAMTSVHNLREDSQDVVTQSADPSVQPESLPRGLRNLQSFWGWPFNKNMDWNEFQDLFTLPLSFLNLYLCFCT